MIGTAKRNQKKLDKWIQNDRTEKIAKALEKYHEIKESNLRINFYNIYFYSIYYFNCIIYQ